VRSEGITSPVAEHCSAACFLPTAESFNERGVSFNEQAATIIYPFSMQIDTALISRLEKLARLQLGESEREKLGSDLQNILDMVDKLRELDTEGVEPLVYLNENEDALRPDGVSGQLSAQEALQNAPAHDGQYFRVPKVIG
jgi:aspartyl-tRNA(Asn)/glutamyl-tRNA(Gln) amidotransferase subunit C